LVALLFFFYFFSSDTKGPPKKKKRKKEKEMDVVYVAASEVAAGLAFGLARRYPQYAARVNGLFASRAVPADAVLSEAAEAAEAFAARPCVARDEKEANAKFVKRGARVCLVATRAIAPHAEILTFAPHDPPARPTRDAKIAYEHLRRAAFYGAAREEKQRSHEREAKRHARRALRAIARANDAAFGTASALKCAECSRDSPRGRCLRPQLATSSSRCAARRARTCARSTSTRAARRIC
jgi:hypothetical protein